MSLREQTYAALEVARAVHALEDHNIDDAFDLLIRLSHSDGMSPDVCYPAHLELCSALSCSSLVGRAAYRFHVATGDERFLDVARFVGYNPSFIDRFVYPLQRRLHGPLFTHNDVV